VAGWRLETVRERELVVGVERRCMAAGTAFPLEQRCAVLVDAAV
jgi:hypothetical protein